MTIQAAMQSAAIRLVGQRPSVFFSSANQFEREIVDLINEAATDICKYNDWQSLITVANFTGDGTTVDFDMPAGYDRMMLTADIQDLNNWAWGFQNINSIDEFLRLKAEGFTSYPGIWSIYNNQFHFYPAPAAAQLATFPYISNLYALGNDGTRKASFTNDDDSFVIPGGERLLTLWLVWRWRENKKLDATGDQENFVKAIDEIAAKDKGSRVYRLNAYRGYGNTRLAWPWPLG